MLRIPTRILFPAFFAVFLLLPMHLRGQQQKSDVLPYMNPSLPTDQRVDDLIGRMTLEEKVSQMRDHAPAIPRLDVPKYDWWNEGLHGVAFAGNATNFPQVIGMAATWDTNLVHHMGQTISTEARAKYNEAMRENDHEMFFGLTFWAPNVNIFRDPRWGRGQETYGEDPFLTSRMGVAFVTGMQGDDSKYFRVISTPKHFAVHSGPESLRHQFNVDVTPHDLEDTYLPAFRAAVTEARAQSVMCAYNSIDGAPACANTMLLRDHLRDDWHFDGYVVSDCAAVADINTGHRYSADMAHAAAAAVKAGTDLECGFAAGQAFPALVEAVQQNLITQAELDTALRRLFRARFRLGMFDPPASFAYGRIPFSEDNSVEHRKLSLQAARESIVLLKNENNMLPLKSGIGRIAVVGPTAEYVQALQGNYNGPPPSPVYPLAGIEKRFSGARVTYAQGSTLVDGFAMPIEHTALHPANGKGDGLTGEYFSSKDLTGKPVLTRLDRNINFNWDKVVPVSGLQRDDYSVRWTGVVVPPASGNYKLGVRVNYCYACENAEGLKLYVDGKLLLENGQGKTGERGGIVQSSVHFNDTAPHPIRIEYFHHSGSAGIDLTWEAPASALRDQAVEAAKQSDVTVAFVGLSPSLEGEEMPVKLDGFSGGDRTSINLPAVQEDLLKALSATGKPLVVVLQNGSALAVNWAQEHANGILEAWYPGEEGGTAIAETLAGDNNPAGRLPLTFYASLDQVPAFESYSMQGRTYRYFPGKPLYGFGFGLSYTSFSYSGIKVPSAKVTAGQPVLVEGEVKNTGKVAGDEVVELYLTQPRGFETPLRVLAAFTRVHLAPGQSTHVGLTIDPRTLGQVDAKGNRVILPGDYVVSLGGTQPGGPGAVQDARFVVSGTSELPK
ncbi:glycoside hydrolase family 3 protein [Granulicella sp. L60]|uniref:glycoside hydrolase family 3 protein n=1 Tax=Granulicella sp. L60 TaxID=1641866 RepID=UPI00131EB600|nr:glycoside hydrolase family 3 protein [Granulicella sp. L60]